MNEQKETKPHTTDYLEILRKVRRVEGGTRFYFCLGCRRHVPKKDAITPCPCCGSGSYDQQNPLRSEIINTAPIIKGDYI